MYSWACEMLWIVDEQMKKKKSFSFSEHSCFVYQSDFRFFFFSFSRVDVDDVLFNNKSYCLFLLVCVLCIFRYFFSFFLLFISFLALLSHSWLNFQWFKINFLLFCCFIQLFFLFLFAISFVYCHSFRFEWGDRWTLNSRTEILAFGQLCTFPRLFYKRYDWFGNSCFTISHAYSDGLAAQRCVWNTAGTEKRKIIFYSVTQRHVSSNFWWIERTFYDPTIQYKFSFAFVKDNIQPKKCYSLKSEPRFNTTRQFALQNKKKIRDEMRGQRIKMNSLYDCLTPARLIQ